jgi:hypothetical protein
MYNLTSTSALGTLQVNGNVYATSFTGSLSGSVVGNLTGTASFASTASSADNFTVRGTLTAQTIVAQTITASTEFITGSSRFGSLITDTHQFTGSLIVSGSVLYVSSSGQVGINRTARFELYGR